MTRCLGLTLGVMLFAVQTGCAAKKTPPADGKLSPISTSGFNDSAHHWRRIRDDTRFIQATPRQPSYRAEQVRQIVDNILLFQRANGGWPKDFDMTAILNEKQKAAIRATHTHTDTSFDNGNIHSQVAYLARAYAQSHEPAWREACERGLDFILKAQYANGGFPQMYPNARNFHAYITFNDYAMLGCLRVLKDAADGAPHFAWVDAARREKSRDAVQRGVECIVKCQVRVEGRLTGWCQQHDERTYEARPARTFELASLCSQDTTEIVRFLMLVEAPSPEVIAAVNAAAAWLEKVKIAGVRVDRISAPVAVFERHTADYDFVAVNDPDAPFIWSRYYEIGDDRAIFASRDGIKKYSLAEIDRERRTGQPWYGHWPAPLLEKEYPEWRKAHDKSAPPSAR